MVVSAAQTAPSLVGCAEAGRCAPSRGPSFERLHAFASACRYFHLFLALVLFPFTVGVEECHNCPALLTFAMAVESLPPRHSSSRRTLLGDTHVTSACCHSSIDLKICEVV